MRVLAIVNQKGGVGKSTLTVQLAYAAREAGLRVLLVDMDRQGSTSLSFPKAEGAQPGLTASALFGTDMTGQPEQMEDGFSIIRADANLAKLSSAVQGVEKRARENLRTFSGDYDLCLIDTPGAIGFNPPMTLAALVAADAVVCPVSIGLYESQGLADLWGYIKTIRTAAYNPRLRLMGLLPSKVNTKSSTEMEALQSLRQQFGKAILPHTLAERSAVKQAIARRKPVWRGTRGEGHRLAGLEWKAACQHILSQMGFDEVKK